MPAVEGLVVEGLEDTERALRDIEVLLDKRPGTLLRAVAEPVRSDAERLALSGITRIGIPWSRMRVGITKQSVYVAPLQRGRLSRRNAKRYSRPNLAGLLLEKALDPAFDRNEPKVIAAFEGLLDDVEKVWGG